MSGRALQRLLLGNAQDVEIDGSAAVLIAPELRNACGMTRDVMLLGMGAHRLWDAAALTAARRKIWRRACCDVLETSFRPGETPADFEHRPVLLEPTVDALVLPDFGGKGASVVAGRRWRRWRACGGDTMDGTFAGAATAASCWSSWGARAAAGGVRTCTSAGYRGAGLGGRGRALVSGPRGFASMAEELEALGIGRIDGAMPDLAVPSPQIDDAGRGFSFMRDGPLDMRMDTSRGVTAEEWLAQASVDEMREVIADYGEERFAFQVAKAIASRRATAPPRTTLELAECVAGANRTRERATSGHTHHPELYAIYLNREARKSFARPSRPALSTRPGRRTAVDQFPFAVGHRMVKRTASRPRPVRARRRRACPCARANYFSPRCALRAASWPTRPLRSPPIRARLHGAAGGRARAFRRSASRPWPSCPSAAGV